METRNGATFLEHNCVESKSRRNLRRVYSPLGLAGTFSILLACSGKASSPQANAQDADTSSHASCRTTAECPSGELCWYPLPLPSCQSAGECRGSRVAARV